MGWPDLMDGGIRDVLLADDGVKGRCGGRIFRHRLPEASEYPALVLTRVSTVPGHDMVGSSGLDRHRIQIDAYAETVDAANALALAVRDRLDNFTGPAKHNHIPCARLLTTQEVYDQQVKKYRVLQDWHVWEQRP